MQILSTIRVHYQRLAQPKSQFMNKRFHVAGDVCLDVLGIAMPALLSSADKQDNWRETGETRTHYRLGGALLLADFIKIAAADCDVQGPRPCLPGELSEGQLKERCLSPAEFLGNAERFTRKEIVHSLLRLDRFRAKPDAKDASILRVRSTEGFSGPSQEDGNPSLKILPPDDADGEPDIVVLDDTGNRFRHSPEHWPAGITKSGKNKSPIVVHKLHRPLPGQNEQEGKAHSPASCGQLHCSPAHSGRVDGRRQYATIDVEKPNEPL